MILIFISSLTFIGILIYWALLSPGCLQFSCLITAHRIFLSFFGAYTARHLLAVIRLDFFNACSGDSVDFNDFTEFCKFCKFVKVIATLLGLLFVFAWSSTWS